MAGVVNFVAVPEFTTVALTWDAVEGAMNYNVGWQAVGAADWTTVSSYFLKKLLSVGYKVKL